MVNGRSIHPSVRLIENGFPSIKKRWSMRIPVSVRGNGRERWRISVEKEVECR